MSKVSKWVKRILLAAVIGAVGLVVLVFGILYFFGDRIYPRLLIQPARYTDHFQYLWSKFDRETFTATTADGLKLAGFYGKPAKQPARGTCLILHGHCYGKDGYAWMARDLTEKGFAVVAFDARGHGESEGDLCTIGALEGADAIAVMQQAEKKFDLPHPRIVIGQSMGAATAIRMITLPEHGMDAAVLISPYPRLGDVARRDVRKYLWFTDADRLMRSAEKLAGRDLWNFAPVELARKIAIPVLMIHGTKDDRFSMAEVEEVYEATGLDVNPPTEKTLVRGVGAGHNDILAGGLPWSDSVQLMFQGFLDNKAPANGVPFSSAN